MSVADPAQPAKDDLGLQYTDEFLATPQPLHSLLNLLSASPSFYPRFYSLQFLSQLLTARASVAQGYIISAPPPGIDGILSVLDSRAPPPAQPGAAGASGMGGGAGEMLRNEALLLLPVMLQGNADLQKIVAFSGAFEKLFEIIMQEGGTDGGIVVQDALTVIGGLLRFNVSNQASPSAVTPLRIADRCRTTSASSPSFPKYPQSSASRKTWLRMLQHRTTLRYNSGRNKSFSMLVWC